MQIYNNSDISTPASAQPLGITPTQNHQRSEKALQGSPYATGDQVQLSSLATKLAATSQSKIGRLQSAVDAGTYVISPASIARSIIEQSQRH